MIIAQKKICLNHEREKWDRDRSGDSGKTEGTISKINYFGERVLLNVNIRIILNSNLLDNPSWLKMWARVLEII